MAAVVALATGIANATAPPAFATKMTALAANSLAPPVTATQTLLVGLTYKHAARENVSAVAARHTTAADESKTAPPKVLDRAKTMLAGVDSSTFVHRANQSGSDTRVVAIDDNKTFNMKTSTAMTAGANVPISVTINGTGADAIDNNLVQASTNRVTGTEPPA